MRTKKVAVTYKDGFNSALIQADTQKARKAIVLEMLKEGMQATAMGLNVMLGANDARKWVATLRRTLLDYEVHTVRLRDRRALYWLEPVETTPTLF